MFYSQLIPRECFGLIFAKLLTLQPTPWQLMMECGLMMNRWHRFSFMLMSKMKGKQLNS